MKSESKSKSKQKSKSRSKARENLIGIINKSAEEIEGQAPALLLSKKIIDNYIEEENQMIMIAMNELKKEIGKLF